MHNPASDRSSEAKYVGRSWHEWLFSVFVALSLASAGFVVWWLVDAREMDEGGKGLAAATVKSRIPTSTRSGPVRRLLFGAGAGGGGYGYRRRGKKKGAAVPGEHELGADFELYDLLKKLKHTWQPRLKELIVDEVRMRKVEYAEPLRDILGYPGHPYLQQAIYVAAELGMEEARSHVVDLMKAGKHVEKSMLAAERIEPWSRDDLRRFLETAEDSVRLTALKICAKRSDCPVASVVTLLSHREASIREAALAALPKSVNKANASALMDLLGDPVPETVVAAVRAIAKVGWAKDAETLLDGLLANPSKEIRVACLDALMSTWGKLGKTATVLDLSQRTDLSLEERGRAVLCLERTGSYKGLEPGQDLPTVHPYLKYFSARCLLQAGDRRAVDLLMEVVEANQIDFAGLSPEKIDGLIAASRKLLFQISGIRPSRDSRSWRAWSSRLTTLPKRKLPLPNWRF